MNKLFGIVLALSLTSILASAAPVPEEKKETRIHPRKENQQKRIAQGVKSGEVTPHEAAKLENKEANLNRQVRAERKANGGNLTNKEKAQVQRKQNRISRDIYKEKHDAQTQKKAASGSCFLRLPVRRRGGKPQPGAGSFRALFQEFQTLERECVPAVIRACDAAGFL